MVLVRVLLSSLVIIGLGLAQPVAVFAQAAVVADPGSAAQRLQPSLAALLQPGADWTQFSVTYDDMHGLYGGLTLGIDGSGKVTQKAVRRQVGEPKTVSPDELKALVALLLKHEAWVQKEAARPAVPDESKARLTLAVGNDSASIWEWTNDLAKNQRIEAIREAMEKAAWKKLPKP